ncbi:MAG: NADH-quinone oxidoreductase subunit A, partial [Acidobacteria bacterium]|nr:NADH-quinone oxidoreductase subunit A [Acidobacteriota bacterium]
GPAWIQFNVRFYIFALIFVVFDVEAIFLFPWAIVYQSLGLFAFVEMLV